MNLEELLNNDLEKISTEWQLKKQDWKLYKKQKAINTIQAFFIGFKTRFDINY